MLLLIQLQEAAASTQTSHPDFAELSECVLIAQRVCSVVNDEQVLFLLLFMMTPQRASPKLCKY